MSKVPNTLLLFAIILLCSTGMISSKLRTTQSCGGLVQPCCTSGNPCGINLFCLKGTCTSPFSAPTTPKPVTNCGGLNQSCCTSGNPCSNFLGCTKGTCTLNQFRINY